MRGRTWAAWVVCSGALLGACSSSEANGDAGLDAGEVPGDAGIADAGPRDAGPPDAPLGDAGNGRVWFSTTLNDSSGRPVLDAQVCELEAIPESCATSNAFGIVAVAIPAATDVVLEFTAEGFRPFLHAIRLDADFHRDPFALFTADEDADYYAPAGGIAETEGQLSAWFTRIPPAAERPDLEGATAEFVEPAGHPVFYASSVYVLESALTSTSSAGLASAAQLAPGTVRVIARDPGGMPCLLQHGGFVEAAPDAGAATVLALPIAAGHETRVDLLCPSAP